MTNSNHIQDEIVEEVDTDLIPELEDSIQDSDIKIDDITEKDKDRSKPRWGYGETVRKTPPPCGRAR